MNRTTITIGLAAVLATAGTGAAVAATGGGSAATMTHVVSTVRGTDDPVTHDRFDDRFANQRDGQAEARHHRRHGHAEAGDDRRDAVAAVEAGDDRSGRDGSGSDGSGGDDDGGSGSDDSGSGHHDGRD